MDILTAETIGRKSKALKHCDRLLEKINKNSFAKVKLNCTGVEFVVHKDDAIYLRIQATRYALLDEIRSYEITKKQSQQTIKQPVLRTAPAPVGAAEPTPEEKLEIKRAKHREYQRRYLERKKQRELAQNPQ